ncbi:MAG: hypothetical protein ACOC1S_04070 [bacterium]
MSEHVVHTAVLEDCLNIMSVSGKLNETFLEIITKYREFAEMGSITKSGDKFTYKLLEKYRDQADEIKENEKLKTRLAFVFGWLAHRSADREMKPIWRGGDFDTSKSPSDCSLYHEAFIFNRYYTESDIYQRALVDDILDGFTNSQGINRDLFIKLVRSTLKRVLIEMHTFVPDHDDVEGWLDKLYSRKQKFKEDVIHRYTEAIINPDPEKVKLYIEETNFYNEEDKINKLAIKLREGDKVDIREVEEALEAESSSHYAITVQRACFYLIAANDYFEGKIDTDTLTDKFDIGKPGRHGGSV